MAKYRSGRVVTGVANTMAAETPDAQDAQGEKPKDKERYKTYKAKSNLPLNLATPNGRDVSFVGGYFQTKDKYVIAFLDEQEDFCELC